MRVRRAVLGLLLLALPAPAAAMADEVVTVPTTTTATVTVGCSLTFTITVMAEDESVPEGTVELTADGTVLTEAPLVDGRATWYATRSIPTRQEMTYVPADDRWSGSTSEVAYVDTGSGCSGHIVEPVTLALHVARIRAGERAPIKVKARFRGNVMVDGDVVVRVTGPRGFSWSRTRPIRRALQLRGPRLTRSGRYLLEASFTSTEWRPATRQRSFEVRPRLTR